jgi:uroporphyrinogen decarboxylase
MTMTSRERWLALLTGGKPDRIPTDYWATPEVTRRLKSELGCGSDWELFDKLHIDRPYHLSAPPTVTRHPHDPEADVWGVRFRDVDYGTGSYREAANSPLADAQSAEDIHNFAWPNPDDHDYDEAARRAENIPEDRIVFCGEHEPFLLYCRMRGMEQAFMDLFIAPDVAEAALGHIFDYFYRYNERMFAIGGDRVHVACLAEDLGSQTGLLMGLEQIRRFILPNQKRMGDLARKHGYKIFYHTDGAARDVLDDLVNVTGIDILNPIQWRCGGMEREGLVRDFGDRLVFHGAIDNQYTLPMGSVDEVRREVLDCIRIFAPARWVCAPCHNIQPVTPTENIVAMYETIHEHGKL